MIDYENILAYKADFRVKYKFRSPDDGGRKTGEPYQGIRSDFSFIDYYTQSLVDSAPLKFYG